MKNKKYIYEPKLQQGTPEEIRENCKLQIDLYDQITGRGGKRDGAGRPQGSTKPEAEKTKPHKVSMTDSEYREFLKRGGARWLRQILRGE